MAARRDCKDEPVLAEWRGNDERGQLLLTDELGKYAVELQTGSIISLAGYAIGMVLAVVPDGERERMAELLVEDAFEFAERLRSADLDSEGPVQ